MERGPRSSLRALGRVGRVDLLSGLSAQDPGSVALVAFGGFLLDLADHVADALLDFLSRQVLPAVVGEGPALLPRPE